MHVHNNQPLCQSVVVYMYTKHCSPCYVSVHLFGGWLAGSECGSPYILSLVDWLTEGM